MRFIGQQLSYIYLLELEISISTISNFYLDPEQIKVTACWRVGFCLLCSHSTLKEKLRASGSNMRVHVVHALYSSFFFCKTPLIWLWP